jgi:hypothetical protein
MSPSNLEDALKTHIRIHLITPDKIAFRGSRNWNIFTNVERRVDKIKSEWEPEHVQSIMLNL